MKKEILIKLIADDLINFPLSDDEFIHFETDCLYGKGISYDAQDDEWCFSGWRANNFIDGYDNYVTSYDLKNFLFTLPAADILHLLKVRGFIDQGVAS